MSCVEGSHGTGPYIYFMGRTSILYRTDLLIILTRFSTVSFSCGVCPVLICMVVVISRIVVVVVVVVVISCLYC